MRADLDIGIITAGAAPLDPARFGVKAAWLSRAAEAGLDVPPAVVLPAEAVADPVALAALLPRARAELERLSGRRLGDAAAPLLVSARPSAPGRAGGLAPALLNLGLTPAMRPGLAARLGARAAADLDRRLVQSFATGALRLDGEEFDYALQDALGEAGAEDETGLDDARLDRLSAAGRDLIAAAGDAFPLDDPAAQIDTAVTAMAAAWTSPRARTRRMGRGEDADAPLAVILQEMALGLGPDPSGAGIAHPRRETTGEPVLTGRYLGQAQGEDAMLGLRTPAVLTLAEKAAQGLTAPALEEIAPAAVATLAEAGRALELRLGEAVSIDFTLEAGRLRVLELRPARRSARAAVRIVVDLAEMGAITREDALMRIDPALLEEHLHPTIDPSARRVVLGTGLPASPGAAAGPLVFSPDAAEQARAAGRPAILALTETSPEDIRGMHAALAVLTVRGGMTSHAAVVARGLGTPCVVGARDLELDPRRGRIRTARGKVLTAGDAVTVDGTSGQVLEGTIPVVEPEITGAFASLMLWADDARRMGVRANADTPRDAEVALGFRAAGIGLCRTEHMFFARGRISAMREMILAEGEAERRAALSRLAPMQAGDFRRLFETMAGQPVVIRLLDPPLHEFLPHGEDEMAELAAALDLPVSRVRARAADLAEFNPMLGKRGCRIGIAFPEIYEMQARAIFEAAIAAGHATGQPVRPEIMIPLVSAVRELELLRRRIDAVGAEVLAERGEMVDYSVGVMIETPRACLRGGDIARAAGFLSFGTNDLTQMLYGLSRDDAGRFMPDYVSQGVFPHDPFHRLDEEGVGEIIRICIGRARAAHPDISIGLCGEHGADPASVDFCERAGFDYVSCSPFRVPIARLAAAQASIRARGGPA